MAFQPVVPISGYSGWRFLQNTLPQQQYSFAKSQPVSRSTSYFREEIGKINSAEDLVNNRRLLEVALGAFGLGDDINNKFFIRKILQDGTIDPKALGNRLADKRYLALSDAFGFGDFSVPNTRLSTFADSIISRYEARSFELAVGASNNDLRLALNLETALTDITKQAKSGDARWFGVMGNGPLRSVFEKALGLPASLGAIDLDKQLAAFKEASAKVFGTDKVGDFNAPETREKLIRLFLVRSEAANGFAGGSSASNALALLQASSF